MEAIQNLTHRRFTDKTILIGNKAIKAAVVILTFAFLMLPFALMIARLS